MGLFDIDKLIDNLRKKQKNTNMAIIKCPECGKEISDKALSCPNCGCPISSTSSQSSKITILGYTGFYVNQSVFIYVDGKPISQIGKGGSTFVNITKDSEFAFVLRGGSAVIGDTELSISDRATTVMVEASGNQTLQLEVDRTWGGLKVINKTHNTTSGGGCLVYLLPLIASASALMCFIVFFEGLWQ